MVVKTLAAVNVCWCRFHAGGKLYGLKLQAAFPKSSDTSRCGGVSKRPKVCCGLLDCEWRPSLDYEWLCFCDTYSEATWSESSSFRSSRPVLFSGIVRETLASRSCQRGWRLNRESPLSSRRVWLAHVVADDCPRYSNGPTSSVVLDWPPGTAAGSFGAGRRRQPSVSVSICRVAELGAPTGAKVESKLAVRALMLSANSGTQIFVNLPVTEVPRRPRHLDCSTCALRTWVRAETSMLGTHSTSRGG
jgi:hypothetical protein